MTGYLRRAAAQRFEYGTIDCATFALAWLDLALAKGGCTAWVGRYTDKKTCREYIARNGGMKAISRFFLKQNYNLKKSSAQIGNVVLVKVNKRAAFGIRVGDKNQIALRTERGMLITKRAEVVFEWGVSCPL